MCPDQNQTCNPLVMTLQSTVPHWQSSGGFTLNSINLQHSDGNYPRDTEAAWPDTSQGWKYRGVCMPEGHAKGNNAEVESPAPLPWVRTDSLVSMTFQNFPQEQAGAWNSTSLASGFFPSPLLACFPTLLLLSPWSPSLINHLHTNSHLRVSFWETWPKTMGKLMTEATL